MDFDEYGLAIPGTYAIAVSRLTGHKVGGAATFSTKSAVCDECGGWASLLWTAEERTEVVDSESFDYKVSRTTRVVVYACPKHSDTVSEKLLDQYGFASNSYNRDELATAVWEQDRSAAEPPGPTLHPTVTAGPLDD